MMIPDDTGMRAFHGDAKLKETLLERLQRYEAQGSAGLKRAMLQEERSRKAQSGPILNPYPKIVQAADIAGVRISGIEATLYAMGAVQQNRLLLVGGVVDSRIYGVGHAGSVHLDTLLGVPETVASVLKAISLGLPPERGDSWLKQFWGAVPVGASLFPVPMRLVLWALSDPAYGILGLNKTDAQASEGERGIKTVQDFLALYQRWLGGGRTEPPEWFSFVNPAEDDVKNSQRRDDDGQYVYDLPASVRYCLLAAAGAARTALVEEAVLTPLPARTTKIQILSDTLDAPDKAIRYAGLYASDKGIVSSAWYEACASALLDILADCPVPKQKSG